MRPIWNGFKFLCSPLEVVTSLGPQKPTKSYYRFPFCHNLVIDQWQLCLSVLSTYEHWRCSKHSKSQLFSEILLYLYCLPAQSVYVSAIHHHCQGSLHCMCDRNHIRSGGHFVIFAPILCPFTCAVFNTTPIAPIYCFLCPVGMAFICLISPCLPLFCTCHLACLGLFELPWINLSLLYLHVTITAF